MVVIDTHVLLWRWGSPAKLSKSAAHKLASARAIFVPAISCWEAAMLSRSGRVRFDMPVLEWMHEVLNVEPFALAPLTPEIIDSGTAISPEVLPDPADRMIVATALMYQVPLVTKDSRIHDSGLVRCIW